ncbi:unnamed protein product [Macrosiphum euphorbiae]|nr:unnamed protein product [Macrosiphum euphorbiae]
MSGQYTGLQPRIKNINPKAKYIPCSGHSLNLIGAYAAESCLYATHFFDLLQKLFNFFSCSTNRWSILEENIGKGKVVKNLSDTRWSARANACNALYASYAGIKNALLYIIQNADEKPICKVEAKAMYNLLNTYFRSLYNDLLMEFNFK